MSSGKIVSVKVCKTKSEFCKENRQQYAAKYNFLTVQQIKGKMEEDWIKLHGTEQQKNRLKSKKRDTRINSADNKPSKNEQTSCDDNGLVSKRKKDEIKGKDVKTKKLETVIELLSDDLSNSVGFIELENNEPYLKLHSGKKVPWNHSTPVKLNKTTNLKDISRLPFSPI